MPDESKKSDLVTFNVSGKIYQVLREPTLSLHPNSLLAQMAEDQKDDKPIFVEGDQDLFKFVIDYHRDRKVYLPVTVSRDGVLHELKRFGLDVTPDQLLEDGISFPSVKKRMATWKTENRELNEKRAAELLGGLYAEAAVDRAAEDQGQGFSVSANNMESTHHLRTKDNSFQHLFKAVTPELLMESESLKSFGRFFGYSVSAVGKENWSWCSAWEVTFHPSFPTPVPAIATAPSPTATAETETPETENAPPATAVAAPAPVAVVENAAEPPAVVAEPAAEPAAAEGAAAEAAPPAAVPNPWEAWQPGAQGAQGAVAPAVPATPTPLNPAVEAWNPEQAAMMAQAWQEGNAWEGWQGWQQTQPAGWQ